MSNIDDQSQIFWNNVKYCQIMSSFVEKCRGPVLGGPFNVNDTTLQASDRHLKLDFQHPGTLRRQSSSSHKHVSFYTELIISKR